MANKSLDFNQLPKEQQEILQEALNIYERELAKIISPEKQKKLRDMLDKINAQKEKTGE